jgi:hypothetical protein
MQPFPLAAFSTGLDDFDNIDYDASRPFSAGGTPVTGRPPKRKSLPPSASLLDMMESGDGFVSVPQEEVPKPPAGSFGEFYSNIERDNAEVRRNLDEARPYLNGIRARNKEGGEAVKRRGQAIVEVWKSSGENLTLAEAVRQAEAHLGFLTGCEDPFDVNAKKRGREALDRIGMKWARGKGPEEKSR